MKKIFIILILISLFSCTSPNDYYDQGKLSQKKTIDSLQILLNAARKPQYYETGWVLVKINGSLNEEAADSCRFLNWGTNGLYRMFDEGAGASLTHKIQDIELCGSCTSFDCGQKLYIISKTPF